MKIVRTNTWLDDKFRVCFSGYVPRQLQYVVGNTVNLHRVNIDYKIYTYIVVFFSAAATFAVGALGNAHSAQLFDRNNRLITSSMDSAQFRPM